jgi:hypothetical protein
MVISSRLNSDRLTFQSATRPTNIWYVDCLKRKFMEHSNFSHYFSLFHVVKVMVKFPLCLIIHHAVNTSWGLEVL